MPNYFFKLKNTKINFWWYIYIIMHIFLQVYYYTLCTYILHICTYMYVCVCVCTQSCLTGCDPMDCSPPDSSARESLQSRLLEWLPFPPRGDLPDPELKPASFTSHALAGDFFTMIPGFPGVWDGKASACSVGDPGSIPGLGRSSGEGNGNPLQCTPENPMDGVAWYAAGWETSLFLSLCGRWHMCIQLKV